MSIITRKSTPNHAERPSVEQLRRGRHQAVPAEGDATAESGAATLLSRRGFLFGALGVGAVAVAGAAAYGSGVLGGGDSDSIDYLQVPTDALTPLADFEALDSYEGQVKLVNSIDVPYGTLVWVSDDSVAACLLPTETGSPLTQVGLIFLGSGETVKAVEESVGRADGFEIYDVRATSSGVLWTEANIMQGTWRIYAAPLSNGTMGAPRLLDEGDNLYETPTLGAVGPTALWQKIPADSSDLETPSLLMAAPFSGGEGRCLYQSRRRNATPLWVDGESAVITPRIDSPTTYHVLTRIDVASGNVTDTLTLPAAMKPLEAAYGNTGFMFSFPDIYDYGEGISNLGTYVPFEKPADGNYSAVRWFGFARTPSAAPAWAGNLLIVKSTYSVCAVDLDAGTYCAIDVDNGAESYGDYLVSTGSGPTFATYSNIDHTPVGEKAIHTGRLKLWAPVVS